MDKEKAIISDGLSSVAPSSELELRNDTKEMEVLVISSN
jgi:hypothetical protein